LGSPRSTSSEGFGLQAADQRSRRSGCMPLSRWVTMSAPGSPPWRARRGRMPWTCSAGRRGDR